MIDRLAVCVDGSDQAELAFDTAVELALKTKSALLVLTVAPQETARYMAGSPGPSEESVRSHTELAESYLAKARDRGVTDVGFDVLTGIPADAILEHLERDPVSLVVVGARGLSRAQRLILGSVSLALSLQAKCSVLVVRAPKTTGKGGQPPAPGGKKH